MTSLRIRESNSLSTLRRWGALGRGRWVWFVLPIAVAMTLGAATAGATKAKLKALDPISAASPYPKDCGPDIEGAGLGEGFEDAETEATIAVDPNNPRKLITSWMQDLYLGYVASRSRDGGASWRDAEVPGNSSCSGGGLDIAADPWLSIGPDGRAYLAGFSLDLPDPSLPVPYRTQFQVNTSTNGGRSWSQPSIVAGGYVASHDQPSITADPAKPGTAYVVWQEFVQALSPVSLDLRFSRTLDGGKSWSTPRSTIIPPPPGALLRPELLVLPDGDLLVTAVLLQPATAATLSPVPLGVRPTYSILALRSSDGGESWLPPVTVAEFRGSGGPPCSPFEDPETGEPVQTCEPFYGADVSRDGTAYIAWRHATSAETGEIRIARSGDGGATWSRTATVARSGAQMFQPALALSGNGTVGVTYHDLRNDVPGDRPFSTDVWFAHSHDRGRSWHERHLAGPYDLRRAGYRKIPVEGRHLGDDPHGLVGLPGGFATAFAMAAPRATVGASDVFFARLRVGRSQR